jgi:hypothetical protein
MADLDGAVCVQHFRQRVAHHRRQLGGGGVQRPGRCLAQDIPRAQPDVGARRTGAVGENSRHPRQDIIGGVGLRNTLGEL